MRIKCLLVVAALVAAGCATSDTSAPEPRDSVVFNPEPRHGPYVVVVVDNHFHDIHPVDDPDIAANRPFVVTNEGQNLHNFSVEGTDISRDLHPGDTLRWARIGHVLRPGTYDVFCRFHSNMTGKFTVVRRGTS
ncbi:MAG: cupredoxin domain-containing protein [Actinomycetota bacterium]|nr:cupredoxin domain-containing protein [Actinomycetota bacterium]